MNNPETFEKLTGSEIAIIGMAGRFPGARDIDAFWSNLREGVESITFFTDDQLQASRVSPEVLDNPNYVKARPVLEDVELFDSAFFGFNPREAQRMDPQQRLFLECVWEAIENAGYATENSIHKISLFAGAGMSSYMMNNIHANPEAMELVGSSQTLVSNSPDSLTTLVAYKLDLKGACYSVQTFCSTSLVAIHLACQCLLNFECDMALAGGVSVFVPQNTGYWYEEGDIVSPDGHCRAFDAKAGGTVFGNGLGVVVLKRLEDALADGDHIEAVILGSATNNDGSLKVSYMAPSMVGQAEVIVEALANAGVEAESISYVETHGTGTALGDPTEITALTQAFRSATQKKGFCAIGSVKTNIGHLDRASGVTSLIKTILSLKHKEIPPSLFCEDPNPNIDFENSPFYVNTQLSKWEINGAPRRAGVSNFGVGGTNAHVILQEAPVISSSSASRPYQLLQLSARTSTALETATKNLATYLKCNPHLMLADIAFTLQIGRKAFNYRRAIVCRDIGDAISKLEAADPRSMLTVYQEKRNPPVVFMLPGQGSQYVNMGLGLYRTESIFQEEVDRCSDILQPHLGLDLRDILYPDQRNMEGAAEKLTQTMITQPALFTIEYALAKLWMAWGVHPEALVGHSIGEYVAACLAGVFSLEDALFLVATRGRLMQKLSGGSMLAISLSEKEVQPFLNERLSLSTINSPSFCVVSGEKAAIEDLKEELSKNSVNCRLLHTSHAFHTKAMDPILDPFTEHVRRVKRDRPQIPFVSNLTGTWITSEEAMSHSYWAKHLRHTVRFSDCVQELLNVYGRVFLEVGPGHTMSTFVRQHSDGLRGRVVLSSVRHPKEDKSDSAFILDTAGRLWLAGVQMDWSGFYKDERRHRLPLPTYPFERQRYWIEPIEQPRGFYASQAALDGIEANEKSHSKVELVSDYLMPRDPGLGSNYVAPKNEVEKNIVEVWQKLLGVNSIGIKDNYFELGGTSLLATQLFAEIEKIFNKRIPIATLLNSPTIEELAGIINDESWSANWSSLVPIQSQGSNPPLFCIHGAGGNVLNYRDLARHLGPDQPFFGLQSKGLDGNQAFYKHIEDMASHYVKEIQLVQSNGPYLLGGYCMGGTVALEMAQQLCAQGHRVALLALLETYNWANLKEWTLYGKVFYYIQKIEFHWRNLLISENKMAFLGEKWQELKRRKNVWRGMIAAKIGNNSQRGGNNQGLLLSSLWDTNDRAAAEYVPKPYLGRITQFLPIKDYAHYDTPDLRWNSVATEGVEIYRLPVYPAGMLVEPFVSQLALELKKCISKAIENKP